MRISLEIDAWHPVLLSINKLDGTDGHSVVAYGYNVLNTNEVRINAPWENGLHANTNINTVNITNFDVAPENTFEFSTILDSVVWFHIEA